MGPALSSETTRRLQALFSGDESRLAELLLSNECGNNLPFCEKHTGEQLERIRFAALKLSSGTLPGLKKAIALAQTDWRDLLMAAGFGNDIKAHNGWFPKQRS